MEIIPNNQWQGTLEATKAEGRQKKHDDQQPDPGLAEGMGPLLEMRARSRLGRAGPAAFNEDKERQQKIGSAKRSGNPARARRPESMEADPWDVDSKQVKSPDGSSAQADAPERRTENKPQAERHTDESHLL